MRPQREQVRRSVLVSLITTVPLGCWDSQLIPVPMSLDWTDGFPQPYPAEAVLQAGASVLWICNPHNPTGQLWSRASLEPLLAQFSLVICDEAFLPLVPNGEQQSLIPLVADHPNLVVVRSLTKLFAIAGLRLGYAVAHPERLQRWSSWRDPWPVNGLALAAADQLLAHRLSVIGPLVSPRAALGGRGRGLDAGAGCRLARDHIYAVSS